MDSYLVTPTSEAESQLLAALFQKMRLKTQVVPAPADKKKRTSPAAKVPAASKEFIPQNQAEQNMLEAVLELREVLAGRKEAMSMEQFWQFVGED